MNAIALIVGLDRDDYFRDVSEDSSSLDADHLHREVFVWFCAAILDDRKSDVSR